MKKNIDENTQSKIDKLKQWADENLESMGYDVVRVVDSQIRIWSEQKNESKKPFELSQLMPKIFESVKHSKAENILHLALEKQNIKFKRQYPIGKTKTRKWARYYLDFLINGYLNVEIDGQRWHDKEKDRKRDEYLKTMGYEIMRFPASLVYFDVDVIVNEIKSELKGRK